MRLLPQRRTLALLAVAAPLLALFAHVALRAGPLAPVAVVAASVESRAIAPALFGIGTVEARHRYRIGPTLAGRVARLEVEVGERVRAGQLLGEMDPVDLDARIDAQAAGRQRAAALLQEAELRLDHVRTEARRYERLYAARSVSEEAAADRRQASRIAEAALAGAREELTRARAEHAALLAQRENLRLLAPVDGVVTLRAAEPGTTVVAGQTVVELIDPRSLWIDLRLDQRGAAGLSAGLPARIALRSRDGQTLSGRVLRLEPLADAVTEELLAKVVFDSSPDPLPPLGELAEVSIDLPPLAPAPAIPNAAVQRLDDRLGVWRIEDGGLRFAPVELGAADLDGWVQVREGLAVGARIVRYSEQALGARSRIQERGPDHRE